MRFSTLKNYKNIKLQQEAKLLKALGHLKYTNKKIKDLSIDVTKMDDEQLETWESFAARFSRVADIFLAQYLRTRIKEEDPGFSGTLRDHLNLAEKIGLIDDAKEWLAIRELRNRAAHEYVEEDLSRFFRLLKEKTPTLLTIEKLLQNQPQ